MIAEIPERAQGCMSPFGDFARRETHMMARTATSTVASGWRKTIAKHEAVLLPVPLGDGDISRMGGEKLT